MSTSEKQRIHRIVPYPPYRVRDTERWLSEQAERGWQLAEDGFFAGFAAFEACTPRRTEYRLVASMRSTSMWSDGGGDPDGEELELGERCGWKYCGKRGEFFVYRAETPDAREMDTDPAVQALALRAVQKRQGGVVSIIAADLLIYAGLGLMSGGFLWSFIQLRTWFMLAFSGILLWELIDDARAGAFLRKMQKALKTEGTLDNLPAMKPRTGLYVLKNIVKGAALAACLLLLVFGKLLLENKIPLEDWQGEPPFATVADLGGEGAHSYRADDFMNFNGVEEWRDLLAPRTVTWDERAEVTRADGRVVDGIYQVTYCETRSPWMAKELLREWEAEASHSKYFQVLETPEFACDEARAYTGTLGPLVSFRKGCVAVQVNFVQFAEEPLSFEEWAALVADSVEKK